MFLKSLEIRGFKSFADKTELGFKKGITGVVGPNGSGKSNISDAVRWVLGEQSVKNLRGAKMEDIIFAGTQFRKPVGLAQVSITLNNEDRELDIDYSDVKVTRRLYRSGESEYLINNNKCRLKDIQELFMDTGIGKEGYSLIGQGKIDSILSGRPEERRSLLEEAAGIVKFKTRKEDAEKKLSNTEQNLLRINDIIGTYEERLEPLRVEMEKAKEFLSLSEELKEKELGLIIHNVEKIESKIKEINFDIEKVTKEIESREEVKQDFKSKDKSLSEKLDNLEKENVEISEEFYRKKALKQEKASEIKLLEEKINSIENIFESSKASLVELKEKYEESLSLKLKNEESLKNLREEFQNLVSSIEEYTDNINAMEESLKEENLALNKKKREELNISSEINQKNNLVFNLNKDIDSLEKRIEELDTQRESYEASLKINANTETALKSEKISIENKMKTLTEEIQNNSKKLGILRNKLTVKEKEQRNVASEINKIEANRNVLINLEKQFEGYTRSVKTLMNHIQGGRVKGLSSSCSVLGEIIEVKKDYEIAIEIALGGGISNIITSNSKDAKSLINYLKQNNLGRATFLPLDILSERRLNIREEIKKSEGYLGIASELVSYDIKFKKAIEYSLGNVVITRSMDDALNIAKRANNSFRIVTLQGEVVNPGGSLTGGSIYHKNASIIGRKREIKELEEKHIKFKKDLDSLKATIEELLKDIEGLDENNLNLKDAIHGQNIELTKIGGRIISISDENIKITSLLKGTNNTLESISNDFENNKFNLEKEKKAIEALKLNYNEVKESMKDLESKLKINLERINNFKEEITDYKIKKAQLEEVLNSKLKEIERIAIESINYKNKIEELQRNINTSKVNKEKYFKEIENIKLAIEDMEISLEGLEKILKDMEVGKIKIKDFIKNHRDRLDELGMVLGKFDKELNKQMILASKLEADRDNYFSKLNEEFDLTYAEALDHKKELFDIGKLKSEIVSIKNKIGAMGLVNVGSIEQYKEIKEKFTFMNNEREDLIKAKEEIEEVIEEMTTKMRKVFKDNFEILSKNFDETFKELFKGGSADLILAEGDELDGKIEINVQPPGKKLQNINLMSGGEKVLSAIALLFAILKMKPTPFCILDEIEAALDDANIVRYAEFLKEFSGNIQFIVITHRKGTMAVSDVLYGITMEERGVSKMVSVDLASTEAV